MASVASLTSSRNPSKLCKNVTFTATISGNAETGFVVFVIDADNSIASPPVQINGSNQASYTYEFTNKCKKNYTITAYYFDVATAPSASINQRVCH